VARNEKDTSRSSSELFAVVQGRSGNKESFEFIANRDECMNTGRGLGYSCLPGGERFANTGLEFLSVKGDFEMTATFEILAEPHLRDWSH